MKDVLSYSTLFCLMKYPYEPPKMCFVTKVWICEYGCIPGLSPSEKVLDLRTPVIWDGVHAELSIFGGGIVKVAPRLTGHLPLALRLSDVKMVGPASWREYMAIQLDPSSSNLPPLIYIYIFIYLFIKISMEGPNVRLLSFGDG
ncbi:hypothetical protein Nepgr_002958 [Nepenthes gracilis]|uniref:Uncharacterized protein n=1 Tax=Nepenthes gracilis TaxID=150966 RepID=A0AAD3RYM4_NEPGR|nr:hypothetical protein Nepgr_002958 [Nepenthes gracilis]